MIRDAMLLPFAADGAAIQDTGASVENFGEGAGDQLDAIRT